MTSCFDGAKRSGQRPGALLSRVSILLILTLACIPPFTTVNELRVGAATVVITPPNGIPLAGYYHERGAEGVLDDLYAKALVLDKDGQKAALVVVDLISTTRPMVERARAEIEKTTGLKPDHVMISATQLIPARN